MTTDGPLSTAEDRIPAAEDRIPSAAGDGYRTASVAQEDDPVATQSAAATGESAQAMAGSDTLPVAGGDIFWLAGADTGKTATHARSRPRSVASKVRTVVAYVLLLAVLGAAGVAAVALVRGTWMVTPILSGSMRPGLAVGGVVISERVPVDSLVVRDVIIFSDPFKPSEQVVHRIVRIAKGPSGKLLINTQGDANTVRDPWTLTIRGNYVYRARWSVPLVGYLGVAYQNHRGYFLLGAGIVLILIAVSTALGARQRRRRRHSRRVARAAAVTVKT
jgi:signal peptidase I